MGSEALAEATQCLVDVEGRLAVCERRRQAIHAAYIRLRDPIPPVFDDARIYEELTDLEERKIRLLHPLEQRLEAQRAPANVSAAGAQEWQLRRAATSPWLYDRLVFYLHAARPTAMPSFDDLFKGLERELNLLEARDEPATLVGLYYALEAVLKRGAGEADRAKFLDLLDRIDARIEEWNRPPERVAPVRGGVDANRKVRGMVARLRRLLCPRPMVDRSWPRKLPQALNAARFANFNPSCSNSSANTERFTDLTFGVI